MNVEYVVGMGMNVLKHMRVLLSVLQTRRKTPIRCLEFPKGIRQRMNITEKMNNWIV